MYSITSLTRHQNQRRNSQNKQGGETSSPYTPERETDGTRQKVHLDGIKLFGRSLEEYEAFFGFDSNRFINRRILDIGAGTASFNAEATPRGIAVCSVDPHYNKTREALAGRAKLDFFQVQQESEKAPGCFNFTNGRFSSFRQLWEQRRATLDKFLRDYENGRAQGRYRTGALPQLDFKAGSFDLVLNGHHLFLYAEHLGYAFIRDACSEMVRLCKPGGEARIYPLNGADASPYPEMDRLLRDLERQGIQAEKRVTPYQVLQNSDQFLVLAKR